MSFQETAFKLVWFSEQKYKLREASVKLERLKEEILSVKYDWEQSITLLSFFRPYSEMIYAITGRPGGADAGVECLGKLSEGMVETGKDYLRTEAENEGYAREIELLIEMKGL